MLLTVHIQSNAFLTVAAYLCCHTFPYRIVWTSLTPQKLLFTNEIQSAKYLLHPENTPFIFLPAWHFFHMYLLQLNKDGVFAEPTPSSIMQFIHIYIWKHKYSWQIIELSNPFPFTNLHQYITYNNPQITTRNRTKSNRISEVAISGSQVEFTRFGKTYTTNLIDKHWLTYPTNYMTQYSYVQQIKKCVTILNWVGNIWVP